MIEFHETALDGVLNIRPRLWSDPRGTFGKLFHAPLFAQRGLVTDYVEHFVTTTSRGFVRGMHFQVPPFDHAKLVSCLAGVAFDVVVDLRPSSSTYGKAIHFELNGEDRQALYIPSGFAHGFAALRDDTIMSYLVSTVHSPAHDSGVLWSSIDVEWPIADLRCSERDAAFAPLAEIGVPFPQSARRAPR